MVKAYLRYEQVAAFGVVASSTAAVCQLTQPNATTPLVAAPAVDTIILWNLRQAEPIARFGNAATRKAGPITALVTSASGDTLAAGHADGSVRVWRFAMSGLPLPEPFADQEPQPLATFNGHRSGVSALAFESLPHPAASSSARGVAPATLISGSNDGDVIAWNVSDSTGKFRLPAHNDAVTALALFTRRNTPFIVSASKDGLVKVYDAESQHCVQTLAGHVGEVWVMKLDPTNNVLVTGAADAEVRVFTLLADGEDVEQSPTSKQVGLDQDSVFKPVGSVRRHTSADKVTSIAFTVCGGQRYAVVAGADKTAEVFRLRDAKQAEAHRKRREKRKIMSVEKDVRDTAEVEAWEEGRTTKEIESRSKEVKFNVEAVDYLVSARQIRVKKKLRSVSFLSEQTRIRAEPGAGIELQLIVQPRNNALEVHSAKIGKAKKKRGNKMAASDDEAAAVEDLEQSNELKQILSLDMAGHGKDVRSCSLSPDESAVLTTSDGSMKLWNVGSQKCIRTMNFNGYGLCATFLGADGMVGAVATKTGSLRLFDLGTGAIITEEKEAHRGEIWSLCLDDHIYEAKYLITGGSDKRICMWNFDDVLADGTGKLKLQQTLELPDQVICVKVAHGKDRPILVVSLMDSTVRTFFLDSLDPYLNFYGHKLPVMSLDVSSDGLLLATGSADKTVKLWGMDFGDCRRSLRAHNDSVLSVQFQPKTHYFFTGSRDGTVKYWDGDKFEFICDMEGQRGEVWSLTSSDDGEIVVSASHDRMVRMWRRTDEPLFLEEERDRRMDEMFESTLVDEDVKSANVERKAEGFMKDDSKGEALDAGKRSLETVKSGERLLEALELCEEENARRAGGEEEGPNPLMLGLSPDAYILRILAQIKSAELEEALHVISLSAAMQLLEYLARLLAPDNKATRLSIEMLTRSALYLIKLHHNQIISGATDRKVVSEVQVGIRGQLEKLRRSMGVNIAALEFWKTELADRDDAPFRDASARAFNLHKKMSKATSAPRKSVIIT